MDGSAGSVIDTATGALPKDPLTGLYQQEFLFEELQRLLHRQRAGRVDATLALLQLENFYEIRGWVGKSEADLLLSEIAHLLSRSLPKSVLLFRCKHYEFAALLLEDSSIHAQLLIQRVKQTLLSAVSTSLPPQLELKCGVGLVQLAPSIPSAEVLFARARHNLRRALSRLRLDGHMVEGTDTAPGVTAAQILHLLRNQQLALNFQPLLGFKAESCRHYEVRCGVAVGNALISATELFECANQNALGELIDRWVIAGCIKVLQQSATSELRFTVNLSLNTIVSTRFFPWLHEQMISCQTLSAQLQFQISELDLLTAQHHMQFFSEQSDQANIRLGIQHFGCTPDPFRYLSLLRVHSVKLDSSWLENIRSDSIRQEQLAMLTRRLLDSGLRVIAGSIEEMRLLPLLWSAGVNLVQGYCLQEPASTLCSSLVQQYTLDLSRLNGARRTN